MRILLIVLLFSFSYQVKATELTAVPVNEIFTHLQEGEYEFKGMGKLFGYETTQSCLWASRHQLIVVHYCNVKREIPARSLSVWSSEYGGVQFYQEDLETVIKRDILYSYFREEITNVLPNDMRDITPESLSEIMEKLYHQKHSACWSTNFSYYSNGAEFGCYLVSADQFKAWELETQNIVSLQSTYNELYEGILELLIQD